MYKIKACSERESRRNENIEKMQAKIVLSEDIYNNEAKMLQLLLLLTLFSEGCYTLRASVFS